MAYGKILADTIENSSGSTLDLSGITSNDATTSAAGYMSAADKTKLDGIEASATADQTGAEIKTAYEGEADTNAFTDAEKSKLAGIEASATADQTGAEIKAAYEAEADTNAFTDADHTKLDGIEAGAQVNVVTSVNTATGAVVLDADDIDDASTTHKFVTAADVTALGTLSTDLAGKADLVDGVLDTSQLPDLAVTEFKGAVANQTAMLAVTGEKGDWVTRSDDGKVYVITGTDPSVIGGWTALSYPVAAGTDLSYTASSRELASSTGTNATLPEVVAAGDSGLMTGADKTKLDGIEAGATADQTGAEIKSAYEAEADTNAFTDAEKTKLSGIATGAEVNVDTNLSYTASTRVLASSTGTNATLPVAVASGNSGLMTGSDKAKLDGIASGAQVNVATNLGITKTTTSNTITSSTGTNATINEATASAAGLMSTAHHNKLDGIAAGATNVTNNNQLTNGAGYITSPDGGNAATLNGVSGTYYARLNTTNSFTGAWFNFNDSKILRFGTGGDAEFFCNGSHFYLDLNSGIGNFYIRDGSTTRFTFDDAGDFTAAGNVTAYSDINLKENIEVIPNALQKVSEIRGVTYDRKDMDGVRHAGVIAQEVEAVLPEVVMTDEEGVKSVAYGNLVGLLIEAVKELKAEVETLKQERN